MAPHASANPGEFDLYLLAQTWAPQLCCVKSERCTTVAWASNYQFWYCGGKARGNGKCQLAHRDNNGSGPAHFPHWGGNFCEWTSTVQKITSEDAGMK